MIWILLTSFILVILSEGTGQMFLHLLNLETDDFAAPVGVAVLFGLLEILYTPFMVTSGSYQRVALVTVLVLLIAAICLMGTFTSSLKSLWRGRTVYVVLSGFLLMGIFACCYEKLDPSLNEELALMERNLHAGSIALASNPMQGYPLFGSFVLSLPHSEPYFAILLLGFFANMITVMLILDIVDSFQIGNPWFRFTLILASAFYYQFYSWKIVDAFKGGNWRIFFTAMLLYYFYQWVKTKQDALKYVPVMITLGGLFVSRGFLLIASEVIYCIGAWMLTHKKIRSLFDITTFLFPIGIYLCACTMLWKHWAGVVLLLLLILFYAVRHRKKVYHHIILVENVIMDHSRPLFYAFIPGVFLAGTFILRFFAKGYGFAYSSYLNYFSSSYLKSYLFMNHSLTDCILDVWRWAGLAVFLLRCNKEEDKMIRTVFAGMVVFFLNPLCLGLLSRITGYSMYAYAFEILLNPFTDVMIFYWIYSQFEWTVLGQWVLELTLIGAMLLGHVASFMGKESSLYGNLLNENRIVEVLLP